MSSNSEDVIISKRRKTDHMPARKYLSNDITISILARLPTKSLLRFSCVSKTWNALFRTSNFITEHHRMYNSNQSNNSSHFFYMSQEKGQRPMCTMLGEREGMMKSNFELPFLPRVYGYCDGLVLIGTYASRQYYIWNPFIGTLKRIGEGVSPRLSDYAVEVGSGFAGRSGDYRVLKISFPEPLSVNYRKYRRWSHEVEMYSLAADGWKIIERGWHERLPLWEKITYTNVFFKGSIYFVAKLREGIEKYTILIFDLDEEVFRELAPPPSCNNMRYIELTVLGGDTLALLHYDEAGDTKMYVSLWLWNEVSTSWTAQTHRFNIPPTDLKFMGNITQAGYIVIETSVGVGEQRTFYIYGYDANHREFKKLTILETGDISQEGFSRYHVFPINKESLFLMDRDKKELSRFRGNSSLSLISG